MANKLIPFLLITLVIACPISNSLSIINPYTDAGNLITNSCPGPFPTEDTIELTTFPIDLDLLFYQDNLSMLNLILNDIGNWSTIWPVTPWGGHFHSGHIEGANKWYLYSYRRLPVRSAHNGEFAELTIRNGSIINYESQELVVDLGLTVNIGNNFQNKYAHINLLKPIFDEIQANGSYSFVENEIIGYTQDRGFHFSIDFHLMYKFHDICPLEFLSTDLKNDLLTYYDLIYNRAKLSGRYPESKICNNHTCEIENTVWGVWQYQNGPYDEDFYGIPESEEPFGGWTIFNRNFSNPETFYREWQFPGSNLTTDVVGVIADSFPSEITEYKKLDHCPLKLIEGNSEIGILEISNYFSNGWGPAGTVVYTKFSIARHGAGASDDILTLEFFDNLLSAQTGFTDNNMTLTRYYHISPDTRTSPWLGPIAEKALFALLGLSILAIIIAVPVIIVRRRKKKRE